MGGQAWWLTLAISALGKWIRKMGSGGSVKGQPRLHSKTIRNERKQDEGWAKCYNAGSLGSPGWPGILHPPVSASKHSEC